MKELTLSPNEEIVLLAENIKSKKVEIELMVDRIEGLKESGVESDINPAYLLPAPKLTRFSTTDSDSGLGL